MWIKYRAISPFKCYTLIRHLKLSGVMIGKKKFIDTTDITIQTKRNKIFLSLYCMLPYTIDFLMQIIHKHTRKFTLSNLQNMFSIHICNWEESHLRTAIVRNRFLYRLFFGIKPQFPDINMGMMYWCLHRWPTSYIERYVYACVKQPQHVKLKSKIDSKTYSNKVLQYTFTAIKVHFCVDVRQIRILFHLLLKWTDANSHQRFNFE